MKSLRSILALSFLLTLLPLLARAAEKSAVPFRDLSFDAATKAAIKEGKLVFIDFHTTWCEPCKRLDALTWTDAAVGKLVGDKTVPLKIDAEKETELARRFKIDAYPTLLLLKPDGTQVDRLVGFREPAKFILEFNAALNGKPTLARAQDAVAASTATIDHAAVQARYDLAKALANAGKLAEALNEYLWCFDEGMVKEKSYAGVRLSFLLSEIERLGATFPLAREVLAERRDQAERRLLADATDRQAPADFAALCAVLGEEKRMLATFDSLPPGDSRRAAMGHRVYRMLIQLQRYPDALAVVPYSRMVQQFDSYRAMPSRPDPRMQEANQRLTVSTALDSIEVLAGANDLEHAREMAIKLLEFDAGDSTQNQLGQRMKRANHPDLLEQKSGKAP